MNATRSHAVVLGGGVSGLLAAQVLAEDFERVTVVERDTFDASAQHGQRAAHSVHRSVLTPTAAAIMEELHPGLLAGLEAAGAPVLRHLRDTHLELAEHRLCRDGALPAAWHQPTRPLLEAHLRARAAAAVDYRPGVTALDLAAEAGRVTGVALLTSEGPERLGADLVVDATGGALATRPDLAVVEETRFDVDVREATVTLTDLAAEDLVPLVVNEPCPARPRGVAAAAVEGGRWRLTAIGYRGHHPPTDRAGLLGFLEPLLPRQWYRAVSAAAWPDPDVHDFAANTWSRWDQVACPPDGLLVIGSGLCRLNPVHTKGMTLAARQAALLRKCLAEGHEDLPRRWYQASGELLTREWKLARAADRLCTGDVDPAEAARLDGLLHRLLAIAETDVEVAQNFLRVHWGLSEPTALLNPALVRKLVFSRYRFGRRHPALSARAD